MRFTKSCTGLALAMGIVAIRRRQRRSSEHRTAGLGDPHGVAAPTTGLQSAADVVADPGAAAGGEGRWARRIKRIAEVAGCALDGAAAARVFIVGVSGVGGVVATAVIAVAALACMG
jgi:hypothetical protein